MWLNIYNEIVRDYNTHFSFFHTMAIMWYTFEVPKSFRIYAYKNIYNWEEKRHLFRSIQTTLMCSWPFGKKWSIIDIFNLSLVKPITTPQIQIQRIQLQLQQVYRYSLTQWYPPQGKSLVVSYKDSWEDCSKCMCKVSETVGFPSITY